MASPLVFSEGHMSLWIFPEMSDASDRKNLDSACISRNNLCIRQMH